MDTHVLASVNLKKVVVARWENIGPVLEATKAGFECEMAWSWSVADVIRTTDAPGGCKIPLQHAGGSTYRVKIVICLRVNHYGN